MLGRDLIKYILDNHLEDAIVDGIDDMYFEVPVTRTYVLKEESDSYLEYWPLTNSVWEIFDDDKAAAFYTGEEALILRGIKEEEE